MLLVALFKRDLQEDQGPSVMTGTARCLNLMTNACLKTCRAFGRRSKSGPS